MTLRPVITECGTWGNKKKILSFFHLNLNTHSQIFTILPWLYYRAMHACYSCQRRKSKQKPRRHNLGKIWTRNKCPHSLHVPLTIAFHFTHAEKLPYFKNLLSVHCKKIASLNELFRFWQNCNFSKKISLSSRRHAWSLVSIVDK